MQYVDSWHTEDQGVLLLLQQPVLDVFHKHAQFGTKTSESGGILLGHVRGAHLEILEATEPTFFDRRLRYFFERGWHGHRNIAERRWRKSNGLVRYVGEWHTHPEDYPTPSYVDRNEWLALAKKREDKRPVLAIIVGRLGLYVTLVYADAPNQVLCAAE
jgi:integrative and conjugative element protein (TIGR02256 family)